MDADARSRKIRCRQLAGRSATALASSQTVQVIAMDGFAGYKTAAAQVIPDAVTATDPPKPSTDG
jgi:hypothetical protein